MPLPVMVEMLEGQTHRRVMKTHLPVDVPSPRISPKVNRYVYVGRDARDVLWSAYNHFMSFTSLAFERLNAVEGPWPKWERPTVDVRTYYLRWLETDRTPGFHDLPFWSHVQGWWDARHRPNIRLIHYANLLADLPGELRRLAAFLDIAIDEARFPAMVEHCGIDYMARTRGALAVHRPDVREGRGELLQFRYQRPLARRPHRRGSGPLRRGRRRQPHPRLRPLAGDGEMKLG